MQDPFFDRDNMLPVLKSTHIDEINLYEEQNEDLSSFVKEGSGTGSKVSKNKSKNSSGESKTDQKYVYKEVPSPENFPKAKKFHQSSVQPEYFIDKLKMQSSPPNKSEYQEDDIADVDNYTVFSGIKGTFYSNYRSDSFITSDQRRSSFKFKTVA